MFKLTVVTPYIFEGTILVYRPAYKEIPVEIYESENLWVIKINGIEETTKTELHDAITYVYAYSKAV